MCVCVCVFIFCHLLVTWISKEHWPCSRDRTSSRSLRACSILPCILARGCSSECLLISSFLSDSFRWTCCNLSPSCPCSCTSCCRYLWTHRCSYMSPTSPWHRRVDPCVLQWGSTVMLAYFLHVSSCLCLPLSSDATTVNHTSAQSQPAAEEHCTTCTKRRGERETDYTCCVSVFSLQL